MRRNRLQLLIITLLFSLGLLMAGWSAPSAGQTQQGDIARILQAINKDEYRALVEGLSGARPVTVGGQPVTFKTRYTPSAQGTLSEQYVYEYFTGLGIATQYQAWTGTLTRCRNISARNVVAEIPGRSDPKRIYLITAHLDSISPSLTDAPGADDDASGTAAVMIAAKIMRGYQFDYTLRFVAFTAEERGLCGSAAYARDAKARADNIQGVLNLDMIAYDGNGVLDVEIHAGTLPGSKALADRLVANVVELSPQLVPHVYEADATNLSDHASFWVEGYPALAFAEYLFHGDMNPYIHSVVCCDTVEHLNFDMAMMLMRPTFATLAQVGGVRGEAAPGGAVTPTRVVVPTPAPTVGVVTVPGSARQVFPETGKTVGGLFLDYWQENGGLAQQGFPISDLVGERSELDGKGYTVQYFERAVFEYHPENEAPYDVLLSQLGTFRYKQKYPQGAPEQKPNTSAGSQLFAETGKRVGGKFLDYWQKNGGLAQQGFPISDEFQEKSELDGKIYTVQYFERSVMELHPENQAPYDVLLSQLGTFRWKEKSAGR